MMKFLKSSLLFFAAVFVVVLIGELTLRMFFPPVDPRPIQLNTNGFYMPSDDPKLIYEHRPNSKKREKSERIILRKGETKRTKRRSVTYTTNSYGFRGLEPRLGKDRPLLVTLGDSNTFGLSLSDHETFPARLQTKIDKRGENMEVINAGVAGYSAATELRYYQARVKKLKPDYLLHIWCMNDVLKDPTAQYHTDIRMVMVHHFPLFAEDTRISLYHSSHIFQRIVETYNLIMLDIRPEKFAFMGQRDFRWIFQNALADPKNKAWLRTSALISKIIEESRNEGTRFALVIIPFHNQVYEDSVFKYYDPAPAQKQLTDFAHLKGVDVIDIVPDFLDNRDKDLFLDICHLAPDGTQLVADVIHKFLNEKGWLKPAKIEASLKTKTEEAKPEP